MGIENNDNMTPPKEKRLHLTTPQKARSTLCKLINDRVNKRLGKDEFRDAVYGISTLLGQDRLLVDTERDKRLDAIEKALNGQGSTQVDQSLIGNPYAQGLKQQLMEAQKLNADIEHRLNESRAQIAQLQDKLADIGAE